MLDGSRRAVQGTGPDERGGVAYQLRKREDVASGLVRLVVDDVAAALADLDGNALHEEQVHHIRQRLKRVRTLLRVLEAPFGDAAVRRDIATTARLLAGARDADVIAASARELALATAAATENLGFDRVVETLDREAAAMHRQKIRTHEVKRRLAAAAAVVAALDTDFDGRRVLNASIERVYRRGRRAMKRSESSLATPDFHRWRKQVKHFWHLVRLARRRLPGGAGRLATRLDRLGAVLGLDHDHAMLAEKLALSPTGNPALMRQLVVIAERRRILEAEAFRIGWKIYKQKPPKFARHVQLT